MSEQQDEHIRIQAHELFDPEVDKGLRQQKQGRERIVADPPPVSPIKRLLLNSLFYLPFASVLGALACWMMLEPKIDDFPVVGGEVQLINSDPFDTGPGMKSLTIGNNEVYVDPDKTLFEVGAQGQPAFTSFDQIQVGTKVDATGLEQGSRLIAASIRPTDDPTARGVVDKPMWPLFVLFPLTAALIALGLLLAEGLTTRNWIRMIERSLLGSFMAALFATLAFLPAGLILSISQSTLQDELAHGDKLIVTIKDVSAWHFFVFAACRSAAWACIGCATGLGMNIIRSTKTQLRNSVIGGALGGALGGLFFDPIDRWWKASMFEGGDMSRLVGLVAVGLSIGIFVALVERLGRDAWLRVRTGPLAGKSFILYKTPTILGSSPQSDVYLFKDAEIDASHAQVHRVGTVYEIEDMSSRMGTSVGGNKVRRRRLVSGDQIIIGSTILDFEERAKRTPVG
ncbi:MAG TPA: FHA domain-containing protein [Kofleriaceae bacterium]|nr:FHA domain-containing protein [Kofleriaceae bacterium]